MIQMELPTVKSLEYTWSICWDEDSCAYRKPNDKVKYIFYYTYYIYCYSIQKKLILVKRKEQQ
jgi:hypothetical protein